MGTLLSKVIIYSRDIPRNRRLQSARLPRFANARQNGQIQLRELNPKAIAIALMADAIKALLSGWRSGYEASMRAWLTLLKGRAGPPGRRNRPWR
jgi:hypothetical protein